MNLKYAGYIIPGLGTLCVVGAITVVVSARAPMDTGFSIGEETSYDARIPENLEPGNDIPTMEQVVEKHLFVKDRKATGVNTFPDLIVKGIYVGAESSAVFSLKYRPNANLRVWQGDVDSIISHITDPRDPRKPIVDFLSEWDIKEITFKGVTVEHIITGEVETYMVDYTPAKHVKDNAEAGYGQGTLAVSSQGGVKTAKTAPKPPSAKIPQTAEQRVQAFTQLKNMVQNMSPEQRARLAERIKGSGGGQPGGGNQSKSSSSDKKPSKSSKKPK